MDKDPIKYQEDAYILIYKGIVSRIGRVTTSTITRMGENDFKEYEPKESMERLIVPMTGLFGRRLMRGIMASALDELYDEEELDDILEELLT